MRLSPAPLDQDRCFKLGCSRPIVTWERPADADARASFPNGLCAAHAACPERPGTLAEPTVVALYPRRIA